MKATQKSYFRCHLIFAIFLIKNTPPPPKKKKKKGTANCDWVYNFDFTLIYDEIKYMFDGIEIIRKYMLTL